MLIRSVYSGDRVRVTVSDYGQPMTKQSFQKESDINVIMAKYHSTGVLPALGSKVAQYLDLPDEIDLQTALNMSIAGQEAFMSLSAEVRQTYNNSSVEFLMALQNPDERARLTKLGIFNVASPETSPVVPPETPPVAPPPVAPS